MPFNGNGTFVLPDPPLEAGEIVSADEHNTTRDDMATGFTNCVTRDGQSPAVANLPMGTYKHTNVGASNSLTNYARTDQVQNSSFNWLTSVSGSNTITAASAVAPAAYAAGQRFAFIPSAVNTDPVTININSLGAKSIKINGQDDLYAGFLNPGTVYTIVYDGTAFQVALANNSGVFYVERFSGDGSETEFTLTRSAINKNYLLVYIYGVYQQKDTYSFSGTTLTFDTAPPFGTDNIEVVISSTLAIGETDASAVSYTLPATGAVTTNVEAKLAQTVSVKDFGAVGDGVTDDTAAIQAALDSGAKHIFAEAGKTYLVSYAGTTGVNSLRYCLRIYSGQTIDFQGSTLYRANNAQAVVLTHQWEGGNPLNRIFDNNIALKNVVVDGNKANNSYYTAGNAAANCGLYFSYIDNLFVDNVQVSNCHLSGFKVVVANFSYINKVNAFNCTGQGWGIDYFSNGFADNLYAEGTTADPVTTQANPGVLSGQNSVFGKLVGKNCAWGFKVQSLEVPTQNLSIQSIVNDGSGVKFQAGGYADDAYYDTIRDVSVDSIVVRNCTDRSGLYFYKCEGVSIANYNSYGTNVTTGPTASKYDIEVLGSYNIHIGTATINNAIWGGIILYGKSSLNYKCPKVSIGQLVMNDLGSVAKNAVGIQMFRGFLTIDDFIHNESRTSFGGNASYTDSLVLWNPEDPGTDIDCDIQINYFKTSFSSYRNNPLTVIATNGPLISSSIGTSGLVGKLQINQISFGPNPNQSTPIANVTLNSAGADTFVNTQNAINYGGSGWYVRPVINVIPMNASGAAKMTEIYSVSVDWNTIFYSAGTPGFTIKHATAAGASSVVKYKIGPWVMSN